MHTYLHTYIHRILEFVDLQLGFIQLFAYSGPNNDDTSYGKVGVLLADLLTADIYPADTADNFPTGAWTHLAFTYDASTTLGTVYSNGR